MCQMEASRSETEDRQRDRAFIILHHKQNVIQLDHIPYQETKEESEESKKEMRYHFVKTNINIITIIHLPVKRISNHRNGG